MQLTNDIITQIINEMRSDKGACIECGGQYFHVPLCLKGYGLDGPELVRRLKQRAIKIQSRTCDHIVCQWCNNLATGTAWVAYHGYSAVLLANPSCESCSETHHNDDSRPSGFLPGLITKDTMLVQRRLSLLFETLE